MIRLNLRTWELEQDPVKNKTSSEWQKQFSFDDEKWAGTRGKFTSNKRPDRRNHGDASRLPSQQYGG